MLRLILCMMMLLGFTNVVISQKKTDPKAAPVIDQKKMAKANSLIAMAMKEKDKGKQGEKINEALEAYREMKMVKEGNLAIGDAFYNSGDLKTAARYYAKGGKENKTETGDKVGKAYLEDALKETDPKLQKKAFDNAYKSLAKAYSPNEANRIIGNEFFDMGIDQYPKALDYYEKGNYTEGMMLIADLYAAKPENFEQAANTFARTKTKDGYKKAGNIYYDKGDYVKAMEYYAAGGVIEGYKKFATELKKAGKINEYNTVCEIISDTLKVQGKTDEIKEIAVMAEKENNFTLAASLYKKLGEPELEKKYTAYSHMMSLDVISAKEIFKGIGKFDIADDIDKNIKQLTDLQQSMLVLKELQKNAPKINAKVNSYNGKLEYDKNDLKLRDQYYGNPATQKSISEVVYSIGKTFQSYKGNEELKGLARQALLKFAPVKNILDNYDFSKKIIPINITPAAVTF
jgi:hypothetical protein